jgi:hypothetical protein
MVVTGREGLLGRFLQGVNFLRFSSIKKFRPLDDLGNFSRIASVDGHGKGPEWPNLLIARCSKGLWIY